jgi:membrane-bound lytic murein transglycosylase D
MAPAKTAAAATPASEPVPPPLLAPEPMAEPSILLGDQNVALVTEVSLLSRSEPLFSDPEGGATRFATDPSHYAVTADNTITVQAEETLGHYADWLRVSASRLRKLNRMSFATPLVIGRRKKLDFSQVSAELFEQRRLEFHRTLQEEFFDAYVVSGTHTHVLRRGDSLWYLAQREYEVPVWLIRQYNPDLDLGDLRAGTQMTIPLIEPRRT